jgi:hypothetical protein
MRSGWEERAERASMNTRTDRDEPDPGAAHSRCYPVHRLKANHEASLHVPTVPFGLRRFQQ